MMPFPSDLTSLKQRTAVVGLTVSVLLSLAAVQVVNTQRVICGKNLADALDIVCAGRGFHFSKRTADRGYAGKRGSRSLGSGGRERSIVDECCRRPCSFTVLESYCAPVSQDNLVASEDDLLQFLNGGRRITTMASTITTQQSVPNLRPHPNLPSAEVFRGPARGGNSSQQFFYLQDDRVTRNPLIAE